MSSPQRPDAGVDADPERDHLPPARVLGAGLAVLRIYFGLTLLLNGLAKLFGFRNIELGPYRSFLIDRPFARGILQNEVFDRDGGAGTRLDFIRPPAQLILDYWEVFGWLVTVTEVGAGLLLVLGLASRLGALAGLGLQLSLALVYASSNRWLFEQPHEYVPLAILALVPAGRVWGLDARVLAALRRRGSRLRGWPF